MQQKDPLLFNILTSKIFIFIYAGCIASFLMKTTDITSDIRTQFGKLKLIIR